MYYGIFKQATEILKRNLSIPQTGRYCFCNKRQFVINLLLILIYILRICIGNILLRKAILHVACI